MARPVAYGQANTPKNVVEVWAQASQPFQANSGRWVFLSSASRLATLASGTNTADLVGWADVGTFSTSSTVGQDKIPVNTHDEATYEMPINATRTESQLRQLNGKVCDIEIASGIQYANYDAATDKTIQIVGYKYYGSGTGEQSLLTRKYKKNESATMVA